jgi:hypothetical protein
VLVLIVMAKVRDHTGSSGQVAISGAVTFTTLAVLGCLAAYRATCRPDLGDRRGGRGSGQRHGARELTPH